MRQHLALPWKFSRTMAEAKAVIDGNRLVGISVRLHSRDAVSKSGIIRWLVTSLRANGIRYWEDDNLLPVLVNGSPVVYGFYSRARRGLMLMEEDLRDGVSISESDDQTVVIRIPCLTF